MTPRRAIYSQLPPAHELPRQPLNLLREREGLPPVCFNRPSIMPVVQMQDGWTEDGRRRMVDVPFVMSTGCKSWSVSATEDPFIHSVPAQEGWSCAACVHYPAELRSCKT